MTTLTPHPELNHPGAHARPTPGLNGNAVRFLLAHRLGRLMTIDPLTGEPRVSSVHYVSDGQGGFMTLLPVSGDHAAAIRRGGRTMLSVQSHGDLPRALRANREGAADIWHVQADLDVELVDNTEAVRQILRRQVRSVLIDLPQHDKSDPLDRASETALAQLVGVRLRLIDVLVRTR
jgi:hypothetical protein